LSARTTPPVRRAGARSAGPDPTAIAPEVDGFAARIVEWQQRHGRHDLPWQGGRDPYRIWVSEVMLQQTQVATVILYFERFMTRFPQIAALARAPIDDVMALWSGLGYYSRARNLHRAATEIQANLDGRFPRGFDAIAGLPGIGRSTAGAIAVFAYGERRAILDGNVKRVLARHFGIEGYPGAPPVERALWSLAERCVPEHGIEAYTQGLMDLGATVCLRARPGCEVCPVVTTCAARTSGRIAAIPAPRPRKALPQRETTMLVLLDRGAVLLEKRPGAGIWGGLWSLPEATENEDDFAKHCLRRFGVHVAGEAALPVIEHGFTHFRLRIRPVRFDVTGGTSQAAEPGMVWLPLAEVPGAALPAPVRTLLESLARYVAVQGRRRNPAS